MAVLSISMDKSMPPNDLSLRHLAKSWPQLMQLTALASISDCLELSAIGGSCARGLSNHLSDVDIYMIVAVVPKALGPHRKEWKMFEGRRLEFQYMTVEDFLDVIERIDSFGTSWLAKEISVPSLSRFGYDQREITLFEFNFAFAVLYGHLLYGSSTGLALRSRVGADALSVNRIIASAWQCDRWYLDLVGNLCAGDLETAIFCGRNLVGYAVDGLLASAGDLLSGAKWRARKLRKVMTGNDAFLRNYEEMEFPQRVSTDVQKISYSIDALFYFHFIQSILYRALQLQQFNSSSFSVAPLLTCQKVAAATDDGSLVRDPFVYASITNNKVTLFNYSLNKGVPLNDEEMLEIWFFFEDRRTNFARFGGVALGKRHLDIERAFEHAGFAISIGALKTKITAIVAGMGRGGQ